MAMIHVSKYPPNQSSITFVHGPLNDKPRSGYRRDKMERIFPFLYNLKNDKEASMSVVDALK
jgi:hypothetical protein